MSCRRTDGRSDTILSLPASVTAWIESAQPEWEAPANHTSLPSGLHASPSRLNDPLDSIVRFPLRSTPSIEPSSVSTVGWFSYAIILPSGENLGWPNQRPFADRAHVRVEIPTRVPHVSTPIPPTAF